jgi:hypothetical protein
LTRDAILAAEDVKTEEVNVPEWGGSVLVRGMTGRERDEFEASMIVRAGGQTVPDIRNGRAKLVARCVVGDDGQPLFTRDDVTALGEKSASALARVFDVASRLSGLTEDDVAARERDFTTAPGSGSPSPSPSGSDAPLAVS